MADWVPIPLGFIQGNAFTANKVLKAELGGTSTVTPFASDKDGNGQSNKVIFNSDNLPTISSTVVVPHIDASVADYIDYILYPTEAAADANSGAEQSLNNIATNFQSDLLGTYRNGVTNTITTLKAITGQSANDVVIVLGHTTVGDGGGGEFYWDSSDTTTDDNGVYIQPDAGGAGRWIRKDIRIITSAMFGAAVGSTGTANTTAIHAAMDFVDGLGGGIVYNLPYSYTVEDVTFGSRQHVTLKGMIDGYEYGNSISASRFYTTTGDWCIRFPTTCISCHVDSLSCASNGAVNTSSAPWTPTTDGVEYGILVEQGQCNVINSNISGFQFGLTVANFGNSNIFSRNAIHNNTRAGFVCTPGSSAAYALYHPNLTAPGSFSVSTVFTFDNNNLRRNGWGMILRDGAMQARNCIVESNVAGGMIAWVGSIDSGVTFDFEHVYFENNFNGFVNNTVDWSTYHVQINNALHNNTGTYIALAGSATAADDEFGFQITIGATATGTTVGPADFKIYKSVGDLQDSQKAIYVKQAYKGVIEKCGWTTGDTSNHYKWSYTGGFQQNAITVKYPENNPPSTLTGNRGCIIDTERSAGNGGATMTYGAWTGWHQWPSTVSESSDAYTMDDYREGQSFTATLSGFTTTVQSTCYYTRVGNLVSLRFGRLSGTSNATAKTLSGIPAIIQPTTAKDFILVPIQDNTSTYQVGVLKINTDGTANLYVDVANNAFTSSNTASLFETTVTYTLD